MNLEIFLFHEVLHSLLISFILILIVFFITAIDDSAEKKETKREGEIFVSRAFKNQITIFMLRMGLNYLLTSKAKSVFIKN